MRILVTAGFDRALHAIALLELARRDGHTICGVLVASPYGIRQVRAWVRRNGVRALAHAARRLAPGRRSDARDQAVERFIADAGIRWRSIGAWARAHGVPVRRAASLNAAPALDFLQSQAPDGVVYAGGGILHRAFLNAVRGRVLNAHAGPLPDVRGMNACEWSILLDLPVCATVHWIDRGIDTGQTVERIPVHVDAGDTIDTLRGKCIIAGITGLARNLHLLDAGPPPPAGGAAPAARQCFPVAPALRDLLPARIGRRIRTGSGR